MCADADVLRINYLDMAPMDAMAEVFLDGIWQDEDVDVLVNDVNNNRELFTTTLTNAHYYRFKDVQIIATNRLVNDRMLRFIFAGYEDVTHYFTRKEKISKLL